MFSVQIKTEHYAKRLLKSSMCPEILCLLHMLCGFRHCVCLQGAILNWTRDMLQFEIFVIWAFSLMGILWIQDDIIAFCAACKCHGPFSMANMSKKGNMTCHIWYFDTVGGLILFNCIHFLSYFDNNFCRIYQLAGFIAILVHCLSQNTSVYPDGFLNGSVFQESFSSFFMHVLCVCVCVFRWFTRKFYWPSRLHKFPPLERYERISAWEMCAKFTS